MTRQRRRALVLAVRAGTAAIWLCFGLLFKVLGLLPRHRAIVATVLGEEWAGPATILVGLGETTLAAWVLGGRARRLCMAAQTAALAAMNTLEILVARDLLLAPLPMVLANVLLLAGGWWAALQPFDGPLARRRADG